MPPHASTSHHHHIIPRLGSFHGAGCGRGLGVYKASAGVDFRAWRLWLGFGFEGLAVSFARRRVCVHLGLLFLVSGKDPVSGACGPTSPEPSA